MDETYKLNEKQNNFRTKIIFENFLSLFLAIFYSNIFVRHLNQHSNRAPPFFIKSKRGEVSRDFSSLFEFTGIF